MDGDSGKRFELSGMRGAARWVGRGGWLGARGGEEGGVGCARSYISICVPGCWTSRQLLLEKQ